MAVLDQLITDERWADVPGYEGLYRVSTLGRVRSLPRRRMIARGGYRTLRERILSHKSGKYPMVSLVHHRDARTFTVHSLVLSAFVGPRPDGMECCHADGNKWNCRLENLRWDSPSGNHRDRVAHGVSNRGERCGTAKLTYSQVDEIRRRGANGESQRSIARGYGISQAMISNILNGRNWSYGGA